MNKYSYLFLIFPILLLLTCNTTEPDPNGKLTFTVEDVSCTEAWLKITGEPGSKLVLFRDDKEIMGINLSSADTILYDDSLHPNKTYNYKISTIGHSGAGISVSAITMDTTSHDFTWQTWTFGEYGSGSSALYDVAIINENNILAVGQIYLKDSLGNPDPEPYGVMHWTGKEWKYMKMKFNCRLYFPNCGPETILPVSASSIFAQTNQNVWVAAGSIHHFDGLKWTEEAGILGAGNANKIWGVEENLWYVGINDFIAHRNKYGNWQQIESGTNLDFQDIWGFTNSVINTYEIYCIASNKYEAVDKKVFKITDNKAIELSNEGLPWSISSIWFAECKSYIVGDGIFVKNYPDRKWNNITGSITPYYSHSIRGNALNDIVVVGSFGDIIHFNGSTWKSFRGEGAPSFTGNYYSVAIKGNIICAVGQAVLDGNKAVITIGIR